MPKTILTCFLLLFTVTAPVAAAGFGPAEAAGLFGEYRLVRDEAGMFWTRTEWDALPSGSPPAAEYGYLTTAGDKAAAVWLAYGRDGDVAKFTAILDGAVPFRDFGRYFPHLSGLLAADGVLFVVRGYPRDGLAAILPRPGGDLLVTFHLAAGRDDDTRANTHTPVRGFTLTALSAAEREMIKMAAKIDNFLQPGLHFSEKLVPRRRTDMIVVHHTKLPAMPVESIHDLHLSNGWAGIGYHKVILPDGAVAEGRPERAVGAHALGVNHHSIGVVLVGDFDVSIPSPAQMASLVALTADLAKKYGVSADRVVGHRDVYRDTTCPGKMFPWVDYKRALAVRLAGR